MIDLYWIPLGADGNFVRLNGCVYEAVKALLERRPRRALYHSALVITVPDGRYVIEMTPVRDANGHARGVVGEGAVGSSWAGRWRIFRYELRCWRSGEIPDLGKAVDSPRNLSDSVDRARYLLSLVPQVPMLTWGRDEAKTGEMWNSNSIMSWLLTTAGFDAASIKPPVGGRAPGWDAGIAVARTRVRVPTARANRALRVGNGSATV
jgi:hypothetical protein